MVDSINSTGRACLLHGPQLGRGVQRQSLWGSSEGLAVERSPCGVDVGPAWTSVPRVQEVGLPHTSQYCWSRLSLPTAPATLPVIPLPRTGTSVSAPSCWYSPFSPRADTGGAVVGGGTGPARGSGTLPRNGQCCRCFLKGQERRRGPQAGGGGSGGRASGTLCPLWPGQLPEPREPVSPFGVGADGWQGNPAGPGRWWAAGQALPVQLPAWS